MNYFPGCGRRWFWLLAGAAAIALAWQFDARVDAALALVHQPAWEKMAQWCSKMGEGEVVGGAGIFLAALFFFLNWSRAAAEIFLSPPLRC